MIPRRGVKIKIFSVCGHLCGQNRFCAVFGDQRKTSKRRRCKALRRFASPYPGYKHGTPKPGAIPNFAKPGYEIATEKVSVCTRISARIQRDCLKAIPAIAELLYTRIRKKAIPNSRVAEKKSQRGKMQCRLRIQA